MILNNVFQAAFLKCKNFEAGKVTYNRESGLAEIEIKGDEQQIKRVLDDYECGGQVDAKRYADEVGFLKYLVKQRMK